MRRSHGLLADACASSASPGAVAPRAPEAAAHTLPQHVRQLTGKDRFSSGNFRAGHICAAHMTAALAVCRVKRLPLYDPLTCCNASPTADVVLGG